MKITLEEGLSRLAKNPTVAAQFDRCAPGLSRREHVQKTIAAIDAAIAENVALKAKVSATKAKLAALEAAKKSHASLTAQLATGKARLATAKAASPPVKPSPVLKGYERVREAFSRKPLPKSPITRADFQKLTPDERTRYAKQGGKLI